MRKLNLIVLVLFSTMVCKAQKDTVKVIMLLCDTSYGFIQKDGSAMLLSEDTVNTNTIFSKTYFASDHNVWYDWGYSVRELHNSSEGVNDVGFCLGCFSDYWKHIQYLDKDKHPLSKNIIVWQSMFVK